VNAFHAALLVALSIVVAAPSVSASGDERADDPYRIVRGVTVSCVGAGQSWGSDEMVATLGVLKDLGVNWVSIHPYGGIQNDGTVGRSRIDGLYHDPKWLTRAIDEAHRLGIKIFIKPHIAYWGSRFSWRGDITFETDEQWQRFFDSYEEWIAMVASLSRDADGFAVGTELDRTVSHEARWRSIIEHIRRETNAPLTYCAGWDTFESVAFWDALDVVGIQAYFPLVAHEDTPTPDEISLGWSNLVQRLDAFGRAHHRDIILGELGYNRSFAAAVRPWAYEVDDDPAAEALQLLCLRSALDAIATSENVVGAFLWKWFPGEIPRGNFRLSTPAIRQLLAEKWATN
jgi:hypothetical protein